MPELFCGIIPACKVLTPGQLHRLHSPRPVLEPTFAAALIAGNPWLQALRGLGHKVDVEARAIPVEEGETSLNANSKQALAGLLLLLAGREQGVRLTVIGSMAAGNHGLDHALARLSCSFPDSGRARAVLGEALGAAALTSAATLLAGCPRQVRKAFARLPATLQRARALRLPAARIAAPDADRLAGLGAALGLDPWLWELVAAAREAMTAAGLHTVADLFLILRSALLLRLARTLGADELAHVPTSLEYLIAQGTGGELAASCLGELAARWLAALARATRGRERPVSRFGDGRFRVLNYYDPVALLLRGTGRGGRLRAGWGSLFASFASGRVVTDRKTPETAGTAGLGELPLAELLARGYGLSGKLTYLAVGAVNGGVVCNQIYRSPLSDIFAALADPGHPGLVLPLHLIDVHGHWQAAHRQRLPVDLLVLAQWLERSPDPPRTLARLLDAFRGGWRDPAPHSALVLGERPGAFHLT